VEVGDQIVHWLKMTPYGGTLLIIGTHAWNFIIDGIMAYSINRMTKLVDSGIMNFNWEEYL
jgi:hypothetical protein